MPMMRDQGIFGWVGLTILHGGAPYKDAWEVKGPAVHLLYALAFAVFGQHEWAVRALHLLILPALAWSTATLLAGLPGRVGATLIAVAIAALATGGDPWTSAQPDEWAGFAVVIALALVWRVRSIALTGLAGACVGAAIAFKPPFALAAAPVLWVASRQSRRYAVTVGAVVPPLAAALWLWYAGAWSAMLDTLGRFDLAVARDAVPLAPLIEQLGTRALLAVQALAVVGAIVLARADWNRSVALGAMTVTCLLVALMQRKFYVYHFAPYLACCAVWCGAASTALVPTGNRQTPALLIPLCAAVGCAAVCVWALRAPALRDLNYLTWRAGWRSTERYRAEFEIRDLSRRSIEDVAARVRLVTREDEPIYVWGFDALLYVLADRPAASRLGFSYAVTGEPEQSIRDARAAELVSALERVRPRVVVVQETDDNQLMPGGSRAALERLPLVAAVVEQCYGETYRNRDYTMYELTAACENPR